MRDWPADCVGVYMEQTTPVCRPPMIPDPEVTEAMVCRNLLSCHTIQIDPRSPMSGHSCPNILPCMRSLMI